MPRKPTPFYWEARDGWYVTIDGQRHNLGRHPDGAPKPKKNAKGVWNTPKEIEQIFHDLMSAAGRGNHVEYDAVAAVLDNFQTWCNENRAEKTAKRYADFLQSFIHALGTIPVSELNAGHVEKWLRQQKTWNSTTKRNAITAIQRAFNWAVKNGGLSHNPIKGMEKPKAKKRTDIVTPDEFELLLKSIPDQQFRDLVTVAYDCGLRPQELKALEVRHLQLDRQRAVIPGEEAKGGIPRAIYFPTERSMAIVRRLASERPLEIYAGPRTRSRKVSSEILFLNTRRRPWTGAAVKCRFEDLEEKVGRRIRQYDFRHGFITRKLLAGVDSHVVASLAGHKDTKMIDSTYSHIAEDHKFMLEAAKKE